MSRKDDKIPLEINLVGQNQQQFGDATWWGFFYQKWFYVETGRKIFSLSNQIKA